MQNNRAERYETYKRLFDAAHKDVFRQDLLALPIKDRYKYMAVNLPALISKASADFLFGEEVLIVADQGIETIKAVFDNSDLQDVLWETALSDSYYGDAYLKVRFDPDDGGAYIEPVDPKMVEIETSPDNVRDILRFVISWERSINNEKYLRREIREWGVIKQELWLIKEGKPVRQMPLTLAYPEGNAPPEEQKTGIDGYLMVHIPNFKGSPTDLYGKSDYADLKDLFGAVNNRITRDDVILDKHSDPKLAVPPGVLDKDGKVRRQDMQMFEVGAATSGLTKPEYITWDGNLTASKDHFDRLLKLVFLVSETSPDVFGMGENGPDSGRALMFRLMRTLAKIKRKKRYFHKALMRIVKEAAEMQSTLTGFEVVPTFSLELQDGLPTDYREDAEIREIEMRSGTISLETAVRERNPAWSQEQVDEEIERIKEDSSLVTSGSASLLNGFGFGEGGDQNKQPNPEGTPASA